MNLQLFRAMATESFNFLFEDSECRPEDTCFGLKFVYEVFEIDLIYDHQRSYEMQLVIGRVGAADECKYDLDLFVAVVDESTPLRSFYQASTPENVRFNLEAMATRLKPCLAEMRVRPEQVLDQLER